MKTITVTFDLLKQGSLLLVNRQHPLPGSLNAERLTPVLGSDVLLERKTALVLENLLAATGCGTDIVPVSGWRSQAEQEEIYSSCSEEHGRAFTERYVARPGCSEHQTGLAIDLALNRAPIDFIRPYFPEDGICGRFRSKMASYGFVERYQAGKEALTGIAAEPWHFRYVGLPHAAIMEREGLCLEEYIDYLSLFPSGGRHLEVRILNKEFEIFYQRVEPDGSARLEIPESLPFQVSGTNTGGCIVTLWR